MDKNIEIMVGIWNMGPRAIAREVGVSHSAVMKWIQGGVPRETHRKNIEAAIKRLRYERIPKILPYHEMKRLTPDLNPLDYLLESKVPLSNIAQLSHLSLKKLNRFINKPFELMQDRNAWSILTGVVNRMAKIQSEEKVIDLLDGVLPPAYDPLNDPVFAAAPAA